MGEFLLLLPEMKSNFIIRAYAPLTIHWSTPGGIWSNSLITGALGSFAAIGSLMSEWSKGDIQ